MSRRPPAAVRWRLFVLLAVCAGCGRDPAHVEYRPAADGGKPDVFEFGHVQVCTLAPGHLPVLLQRVDAFARGRWMYPHAAARPGARTVAVHTRGAPMRVHLMVERLARDRYRVGISSHGGAGCDEVCARAAAYDFCPSAGALPRDAVSAAWNATAR